MLQLIEEHLATPDALTVELKRIALKGQIVDLGPIFRGINASSFLFNLALKILPIGVLTEEDL